jgi:hypothetical protein
MSPSEAATGRRHLCRPKAAINFERSIMFDIPRFSGEIKAEDPKYFKCDMWPCKNKIEVGDEYKDDRDRSGRRFCTKCGKLYAKNADIKVCTEEDCE